MFLEYITTFHLQDCLNILSATDVLGYYSIKIDFLKLFETYPDVGDKVLCSPISTLPSCDKDIIKVQQNIIEANKEEYQMALEKLPFKFVKRNVHARFFGLPVCPELHRNIFPKNIDLGCFLKVAATVVRVTQSKMLEYQRKYICMKCKYENKVEADFENRYILKAPSKCGNTEHRCKCSTFTQISLVAREYCKDYQEIKIQEQVNKLSIGTIPGSMWVVLEDDLVDCCKPGDDVIICGTVRRRWRPSSQNKKSEVELVLQSNYIEVVNAQRSHVIAMAPDIKDCFDDFWEKYQHCPLRGRDQILASICPQVYGLYLVKLAVLLTVITGSNHVVENDQICEDHCVRVRGQCHLLLVGDPGTGKSQLLKASAELTPRSVFTSGAGSTRAGLTCAALREDGDWQLEAGALVLSDGGVCCIDEISHLREHDRTAIHEAMEQQTISVAKAGIVCKLNTRCAVIAACNPKGHYQTDQPLSVNVSLGTPLLSRFDLIFILLDCKNKSWDKLVSSYILFGGSNQAEANKKWSIEKLQMYIGLIGPRPTQMTKSANTILQCYYMMQRKSEHRDPSRTTVRMLDSLIRLSQAHCRLMYRTTILPIDAITAISLCDLSMQDCTLDETVDALHSTFLKYPDFDYLCKAKQVLTKMSLYEIWKEELLYYGNLLEVDHKTLENDINNKNYSLFSKYDDVSDDNIPLSATLVTSSYFNNKKNKDKRDDNDNKHDTENSNKVISDKLAATLKKHATLNKVDKKPPVDSKRKYTKRKRKEVVLDTSKFKSKKQKKAKDSKTIKIDFNLTDSDESDIENNSANKDSSKNIESNTEVNTHFEREKNNLLVDQVNNINESENNELQSNAANTSNRKDKIRKKENLNTKKSMSNIETDSPTKNIKDKKLKRIRKESNKTNKKQKILKNKKTNSDLDISDDELSNIDPKVILNCIPSVNDDFTKIGIDFNLHDISDIDFDENLEPTKTVVESKETNEKKIEKQNLNSTANKLKEFQFTAKHDLDKFYNEKVDSKKSPVKLDKKNRSLSNSTQNKESACSSQISMFESSDCDIDLDI